MATTTNKPDRSSSHVIEIDGEWLMKDFSEFSINIHRSTLFVPS
jgi:hypothetical protein